jgi:hypothetical protein
MSMDARAVGKRPGHPSELEDWTELQEGDPVEIIKNARTIGKGLIEEVSASGNVLWLRADGIETRRLYTKSEGVLVRRA